jgi:FkbM family methyltransferase
MIVKTSFLRKTNTRLAFALTRIRPAQLASLLKWMLRIKRVRFESAEGFALDIDPASQLGKTLLSFGEYDPKTAHFLKKILRPCDIFIDIGANEGYFTLLGAKLVGESGLVHSIEPQTRLHPVLKRNIAINSLENSINLHQLGLSDKIGTLKLYLRPSINTGSSSLNRHWKLGWSFEEINVITLDHFFESQKIDRVRLVKIDCEGAEPEIIKGSFDTLKNKRVDFFIIEHHPQIRSLQSINETENSLIKAGYQKIIFSDLSAYRAPGIEESNFD